MTFNADTATRRSDAGSIDLSCSNGGNDVLIPRPTRDGSGLIVARGPGYGQPTRIERCQFGVREPALLVTTPGWTLLAKQSSDGTRLLLGDQEGALSIATLDGSITPLSAGPFIDAAW
jgi:hypothetical protein